MIEKRPASERGHANHGWLDTWYSFSFADYYDPAHMGWGSLRVINDDTIDAAAGFPTHGHRDMEIVTLMLEGALEHRDSMGNGTIISAGEVQRMSAGRGVTHSEFNPSKTSPGKLLQIWIRPRSTGGEPSYEQKAFHPAESPGTWQLLASGRKGARAALSINQDADVRMIELPAGSRIDYRPDTGRKQYVHVIRGALQLNNLKLGAADGAKIADEARLDFVADTDASLLLFDVTD